MLNQEYIQADNPISNLFSVRNNVISVCQYLLECNQNISEEIIYLLEQSEAHLNAIQRWFIRNPDCVINENTIN